MEEPKKFKTEETVTMTDCVRAVQKLRNCYMCANKQGDPELCKRCTPDCIVNVCKSAIIFYFRVIKKEIPIYVPAEYLPDNIKNKVLTSHDAQDHEFEVNIKNEDYNF